jgi:hypothetical protein
VYAAKVVVIGAGVSGMNAARSRSACRPRCWCSTRTSPGCGRSTPIYRRPPADDRVQRAYEIEKAVLDADLVIGAVLVPGAKAPKLVSNDLVSRMKPGSVLVDIAIDQGGCFEDSRPTTHADPVYRVHDSMFYCVANMPGAVPNTSTYALTNVTLPYAELAGADRPLAGPAGPAHRADGAPRRRDHYEPISWDDAFALIARTSRLDSPDEAVFYTSGRTSNEAAFLYQLFARAFGTNNLPDCSNMCHESTGGRRCPRRSASARARCRWRTCTRPT